MKKRTGESMKDLMLGEESYKKDGASNKSKRSNINIQSIQGIHDTKKKGLKSGWIRATLIIRENYLKKIKNLAYWDRKNIKDVVDEALKNYLKNKKINQSK